MRQFTISITIVARATKKDNTISTLFARITYNSKRAEISLNRNIESRLWDTRASRAKGISDTSRKINNFVSEIKGQNCAEDRESNELALTSGRRIFSVYECGSVH